MKPDALALFRAIATGETPRDAGERLGIHPKRVAALCEKWTSKGHYEYGVTMDLGWLTATGREFLATQEALA
jgi:hypothetical protein